MTQVRFTPVDQLIPYVRNSRTHSAEQVAQIAASKPWSAWHPEAPLNEAVAALCAVEHLT